MLNTRVKFKNIHLNLFIWDIKKLLNQSSIKFDTNKFKNRKLVAALVINLQKNPPFLEVLEKVHSFGIIPFFHLICAIFAVKMCYAGSIIFHY